MNKFFVLHITNANGAIANEFFAYDSIEQAQEKFHALLAYDYNASVLPNLDGFVCEVLDGTGLPVERKAYNKPEEVTAE